MIACVILKYLYGNVVGFLSKSKRDKKKEKKKKKKDKDENKE